MGIVEGLAEQAGELTDLLGELLRPGVLLILASLALVVVLFILFRRLGKASEAASYVNFSDEASGLDSFSGLDAFSNHGESSVLDLRRTSVSPALRQSFVQARRLVRQILAGRRSQYQLPWFLSLGPAGAGKTALLSSSELHLPLGRPGIAPGTDPDGCQWWLFDRAVVLDVQGDFLLGSTTCHRPPPWPGLLRLLKRHRGRRPLDGLLLMIPAGELYGFASGSGEASSALAQRASILCRRLRVAQEQLGMRLPVHVVVTRCDAVPGFGAFAGSLDDDQRRQIFGWSNPEAAEIPYNGAWVDSAFLSLRRALSRAQLRALDAAPDLKDAADLVAFPAALETLKAPLRIYLNQIFSQDAVYESFPLRGIYFCGGQDISQDFGLGEGQAVPEYAHRHVDFVRDLFTHKVFAEWSLARPTQRSLRASQRRSAILRALVFTLLLAGPLVLVLSGRDTSARAEILQRRLLSPTSAELTAKSLIPDGLTTDSLTPDSLTPDSLTADRLTADADLMRQTLALLEAAGEVPDYRLRSLVLPPSWSSRYAEETAHVMSDLYEGVVFPTTLRRLEERLDRATLWPVAEDAARPIFDASSTPELLAARGLTDELGEVETGLGLYNCFSVEGCGGSRASPLDDFRQLVARVYRADLRPPTFEARGFYNRLLGEVRLAPYQPAAHQQGLRRRTLELAGAMHRRLFDDHVLTLGLGDLERRIDQLARHPPPDREMADTYAGLLDALDATADHLARPDLAWVGAETFQPGTEYNAWQRSIISSAFLGRGLAIDIKRRGIQGFDAFRASLVDASTEALGPLLQFDEEGQRFELAPRVQGFQAALEGLLEQRFMRPRAAAPHLFNTPPGSALFWRLDALERAVALHTHYEAFISQDLAEFEGLREVVRQSARQPLEANMLELVSEAQQPRPLPDLLTREIREAHVLQQVFNLQSASAVLTELLARFEAPPATPTPAGCAAHCSGPAASAWCQLTAILENQRQAILRQLDELLQGEALYTPKEDGFAWWDGGGNVAWRAFDVADEDALDEYLALQLDRTRTLVEAYARPALTAVQTRDCWGSVAQPAFRRWMVLLSDFGDYDNQKPDNVIADLENFLSTTLPEVNGENCLTTVVPKQTCHSKLTPRGLRRDSPCDFFLEVRSRLERGVDQRCDEITMAAGLAAYPKIELEFRHRLEGKFPFSDELNQPLVQEATPADVWNFFRVFDREREQVERLFTVLDARGEADSLAGVRRFMAEVGKVRDFFAFFLEARAEDDDAVPVYDLQVQFRVPRENEVRGNQIIRWTFQVGDDVVQPGDIDPPGRWAFGEPVVLSLDWATNAETRPIDPERVHARVDGKTVIFDYQSPWSLISLMKENQSELIPRRPDTMAFQIPAGEIVDESLDEKGRRVLQIDNYFTVKVFLRVTILTPDGEKVKVPFPLFPAVAPSLPVTGPITG